MSSNDSTLKTGVYQWRNVVNGKVYVGSASRSLILRERVHRSSLRGNYHGNRHFQAAWNKYGEAAFTFEVIERCPPEQCLEREQHWIDAMRSADPKFGYNLDPKAGSNLGYRFTPDQKAKVSAGLKGRVFSEEHRAALRGRKSPETRARMSEAQKKIAASPEGQERTRKRIEVVRQKAQARRLAGGNSTRKPRGSASGNSTGNPRVFTEEHKKSLSEAAKRRWQRSREQGVAAAAQLELFQEPSSEEDTTPSP